MTINTTTLFTYSMAELVELHNSFEGKPLSGTVHKPCTVKTFNSKRKIIDRIRFYETCMNTEPAKINGHTTKKDTITAFANRLLMEPGGCPYLTIVETIKGKFPDAKTNVNCLRWYATKLREGGKTVPERGR